MTERVLVDSNILLDILTDNPRWAGWSSTQLETCANSALLVINPIVYSEVSLGFAKIEELENALPSDVFARHAVPWEAAFLAGKCFLRYRRAGGVRRSPLPDFYIGAHAAVEGMRLLTRDRQRYQTYFPQLPLITPD